MNQNSPEVVAEEILNLARSQLLVNFRFLDRALLFLQRKQTVDASFLSDGYTLYYDPWFICRRYQDEDTHIARAYLHLIFHFVFKHFLVGPGVDKSLWNLSCDIAAESMITALHQNFLNVKDEMQQKEFIDRLVNPEDPNHLLNAEYVYSRLEKMALQPEEMDEVSQLFWQDSHSLWYDAKDARASRDIDVVLKWEDISKRMETELEMTPKEQMALLVMGLKHVNRAKKDYKEFLKKFMTRREILKISDEEFDNNYYTYGMQLYGNVPIIENLEYSEQRRITDFVIAIDTSGSIQQEMAQTFIAHTYAILSTKESFLENCRLHILQCDDRIREDAVLRSDEDIKTYIKNIEIKGRGETDFRPVFQYIHQLQRRGEIKELRGVLYFTDGEGIFPEEMPPYDTAFILHEGKGYKTVSIPSWAMHVELSDEDLVDVQL